MGEGSLFWGGVHYCLKNNKWRLWQRDSGERNAKRGRQREILHVCFHVFLCVCLCVFVCVCVCTYTHLQFGQGLAQITVNWMRCVCVCVRLEWKQSLLWSWGEKTKRCLWGDLAPSQNQFTSTPHWRGVLSLQPVLAMTGLSLLHTHTHTTNTHIHTYTNTSWETHTHPHRVVCCNLCCLHKIWKRTLTLTQTHCVPR